MGLQNEMVLINTLYDDADGIYFNGKHPVVDQGGAWARTTYMAALLDPKFAVQVEFKIEDLDDQVRCIVVCGLSLLQQYLGLFVLESGDFAVLLSNHELITLKDVNPQENVWYKFTMVYDTLTNNAKFYLGSNLVESANHQVVRVPGDGFVSNYYPAGGYPLKGNWRNLRIYGTEEITALEDELDQASAFRVFPNPAAETITIDTKDTRIQQWTIYDPSGRVALHGDFQPMTPIDIHQLPNGHFVLMLRDKDDRTLAVKSFSKQ
ncbi:MAG TPA: T9SS type A sorting domain-containing protein [Saprospiraceae bacterium]